MEITPCAHTFTGSAAHPLSVYGLADAHFVACGFVPENGGTRSRRSPRPSTTSRIRWYPVVSVGRVHVIAVLDRNFAVAAVPVVAVVPVVDEVVAVNEGGFTDAQARTRRAEGNI